MTIKPTSQRHVTTLLFLLRYYADQQRRMHGPMVERPGGIELTPNEMEAWADEIEAEALSGNSASVALGGEPLTATELRRHNKDVLAKALPGNSTEGWLDT